MARFASSSVIPRRTPLEVDGWLVDMGELRAAQMSRRKADRSNMGGLSLRFLIASIAGYFVSGLIRCSACSRTRAEKTSYASAMS